MPPYSSPLREAQAAQTRQRILEAAIDVFGDAGYSGASLARIAKEAGVSLDSLKKHDVPNSKEYGTGGSDLQVVCIGPPKRFLRVVGEVARLLLVLAGCGTTNPAPQNRHIACRSRHALRSRCGSQDFRSRDE